MPQIAFLHTAKAHVATFEALLANAPGVTTRHVVRPGLLTLAQAQGLAAVRAETARLLHDLSGAVAVVGTCSTLGPLVDGLRAEIPHLIRIDRPLMQAAAVAGPRCLLVLCLDSTRAASVDLLRDCGTRDIDVLMCAGLWPLFLAGDHATFHARIADRVRAAWDGQDSVVLGQASMAGAGALLGNLPVPVLSAPRLAVGAALALMRSPRHP